MFWAGLLHGLAQAGPWDLAGTIARSWAPGPTIGGLIPNANELRSRLIWEIESKIDMEQKISGHTLC
jgi:hypothetical protein